MSKQRVLLYILIAVVLAGAGYTVIQKRYGTVAVNPPKKIQHTPTPTKSSATPTNDPDDKPLPLSKLLNVPFTSQAPTANWDALHNEACEEASAIMANAYFSGMTDITLKPEFVESELAKLTEWEKETFGYYLDIDSRETAKLLETVYGLKTRLITDYTETDLKREIANGHLVLLAANGRLLGNPNFRPPGPIYHMLVVRGYTQSEIITNDPGTRKGLNYSYDFETLYNAAGEWDHDKHQTDPNKKIALVVWKE